MTSVFALAADEGAMRGLGAALAGLLRPGDTVLLGGDLGAGKTTFTQGLAAALGATGPVTSPTFVLVHSYRTSAGWDLLHADVWRLEQLREVVDLAIPELLEDGAAAVVEWGELAAPALPADCLHVAIDFCPGPQGPGPEAGEPGAEGTRRLVFSAGGPSWEARMGALSAAVSEAVPGAVPARGAWLQT
ncbi:MAG TPA: tRNA (adenosine(37)-N6)-threonylcarbamoyltransferase complex ATPase subunit type 1 TsaE [Acidimicrobiales bacterium]|nr:tRNA (adenosine(37)-N6)-threonylcarbamoyltransferase complex ATPase subunit type 1 TsaE [Acidimicrobiales bacterium]